MAQALIILFRLMGFACLLAFCFVSWGTVIALLTLNWVMVVKGGTLAIVLFVVAWVCFSDWILEGLEDEAERGDDR